MKEAAKNRARSKERTYEGQGRPACRHLCICRRVSRCRAGHDAAHDTAPPINAGNDIVVTAQRRAESLQSVPIAVSAFSAEALEAQQIDNASDLQLTLPNVTFSKGNFTGSSFTIRGIGDLCVGTSCDAATAIHLNGSPLFGTRLFETEYFDLERIEVLRGPQGTLFGRNATSGVVNFITAKPDLSGFHAAGEAEYGNYNSIKAKGMINLPARRNAWASAWPASTSTATAIPRTSTTTRASTAATCTRCAGRSAGSRVPTPPST